MEDHQRPLSTSHTESLLARIDAGVKEAIAEAVEAHRKAGRAIVVWRDGKVVTIPASEIPPLRTADIQP